MCMPQSDRGCNMSLPAFTQDFQKQCGLLGLFLMLSTATGASESETYGRAGAHFFDWTLSGQVRLMQWCHKGWQLESRATAGALQDTLPRCLLFLFLGQSKRVLRKGILHC